MQFLVASLMNNFHLLAAIRIRNRGLTTQLSGQREDVAGIKDWTHTE
jgi:hypothetical protein